MTTIYFQNPGEIDPRVITTLGVNVKEGDSPIGYFGTGLKYALAVLLRTGHEVQIYSGTELFTFRSKEELIRGKVFHLVQMAQGLNSWKPLGFTTDLGKNWTVENAYRELHSNSLDESGEPGQVGEPSARQGHTTILVRGSAFAKAHRERFSFLLDPARRKLCSDGAVEVFAGKSDWVFYRGIAALRLHSPSCYLYNITKESELTEDRSLASEYTAADRIGTMLAKSATADVCEAVFTSKDSYEAQFHYSFVTPSEQCLDVIERITRERPLALQDSVRNMFVRSRKREVVREKIVATGHQASDLASAVAFCEATGFAVSAYPIVLCRDLGQGIVALAEQGTIFLSPAAFEEGVLRRALVEEYIHLRNRVDDETRRMQNVLFTEIERLGEELLAARVGQAVAPKAPHINDDIPF